MSAKDFFLTELPPLIVEMKKALGDRVPKVSYDIEFEIEGEGMAGSECYVVGVKNGDATVRRGGSATPLVSMSFSKATWDESLDKIVRPRLKHLAAFDPQRAEGAMNRQLGGRKPVAPEAAIGHIKGLPLRVVLELEPKGAHKFELKLAAAEEDDPTVTVTVKQDDLEQLIEGKMTAQEAFKTGRLRMKGAVPTVMALLSRLFT